LNLRQNTLSDTYNAHKYGAHGAMPLRFSPAQ
jgi:hypothetical protein